MISSSNVGDNGVHTNLLRSALVACGVAGSLSVTFTVQRISGSLNEMSIIALSIVAQGSKHCDTIWRHACERQMIAVRVCSLLLSHLEIRYLTVACNAAPFISSILRYYYRLIKFSFRSYDGSSLEAWNNNILSG